MNSKKVPGLTYKKKTNMYTNSTGSLTFNPATKEAFSYKWWKFVAVVEGKVIFNNYPYSMSTSRHQRTIQNLLSQLNIKIDLKLPLSKGINGDCLQDIIIEAEELLCDQFLNEQLKKQFRYERAKQRKSAKKLKDYLENSVAFRDYEIKEARQFGHINTIAVHQVVDIKTMESDVENALYSFHRDGFTKVVFYV